MAEVVEHLGLPLQHVDKIGFIFLRDELPLREENDEICNFQGRGARMAYKDCKFRLGWAAAAFGKDAGDAITALAQAIGKRGFT